MTALELSLDELRMPPPIHTSNDPWPPGFKAPVGASRLMVAIKSAGWPTKMTYAQGYVPGVKKGSRILVHSVAVRFRRTLQDGRTRGGYVAYEAKAEAGPLKWVAKGTMLYGVDHMPAVTGMGITEVKLYVTGGVAWTGAQVGEWAYQRKLAVEAMKAEAAAKAKAAPKKAKVI